MLQVRDHSSDEPGTLVRIFEGDLPSRHAARKAAKADLEALTALPAFDGFPYGALMAIGSGLTARRYGAALIALDAQGRIEGSINRFDLGSIDGVPLSFTDGAALPDGGWVFSAAAENTSDRYADGLCLGSAIGIVGADGHLRTIERLPLVCKVEGIVATVDGDNVQVLLVTDADDRRAPALLLTTTLSAARTPAATR